MVEQGIRGRGVRGGRRVGWTAAVAIVAAVAGLGGCDTAPPVVQDDQDLPHAGKVYGVDTFPEGAVVGDPVVRQPRDGRPLQVGVDLRTVSNHVVHAQYRFEFLTPEGEVTNPDAGWRYARLEPGVPTRLQGSPRTMEAVDWRLVVRPSR